jgi:hypothetical protein
MIKKAFKNFMIEVKAKDNLQDVLKKYRSDWEKVKSGKEDIGSKKVEKFYNALFDYFADSGEMPLGTQKARTGDPHEWIHDRLMDEGTNARQRGEVQSPRSQKEYDALSPADKKIVDARTKRAFKQSISRQPGESPRNKRTKRKKKNEENEMNEVLMVRTQKTKDGDYEWLVQKVEHNKTETLEKGTEASRAKAMAAGKKAKKNLKEEKEETINEELAYLPSKDGKQTFVVSKRNTKGMRGKQDKFSMSVIDTKTKKEIEDIGSHVSLKGAIKFALNRGFVKKQKGSTSEIKYNQSPDELSKSFRYDTLTGMKEASGGGGHPRKAPNFDERQKMYASAYRNVHKKAPSRDELRAAGVGKGGDNPKGVKAWKAAMAALKGK